MVNSFTQLTQSSKLRIKFTKHDNEVNSISCKSVYGVSMYIQSIIVKYNMILVDTRL